MDYENILLRDKKAIDLLQDYFIIDTLFKNQDKETNTDIKIEDLTKSQLISFLNQFFLKDNNDYKSYDIKKEKHFIEYFELKDENYQGLYNSLLCLISDLLTIIKLKENKKGFKKYDINFNNKDFNIKIVKKYNKYYLIIDNRYPIIFTSKEKVLGYISLNDNKYWYSYLNSIIEYYLQINRYMDNHRFIDIIINKLN